MRHLKNFGQILNLLLAFLFVGYAGGINVGKHLCNGDVVSRAINFEVKVCKKAAVSIDYGDETSVQKKSCCDTEIDFFKSFSFEKTNIVAPAQIAQFTAAIHDVQSFSIPQNRTQFKLPKPPLLATTTAIYIKIERFLI